MTDSDVTRGGGSDRFRPALASMDAARLLALGFLTLFLELVLIRYLSGHIWNLGYFPNLVLISVFVGMGIGFVFHRLVDDARSNSFFVLGLFVLAGLIAFVNFAHPSVPGFDHAEAQFGDELFFTKQPESAGSASLTPFVICFMALVAAFSLIAQRTAKLFAKFAPLRAYSLDIGGSCLGIVVFMWVSWLQLPAWGWMLLLAPVVFIVLGSDKRLRLLGVFIVVGVAAMAWQRDGELLYDAELADELEVRWSPYQKIEYVVSKSDRRMIMANGILHQFLETPERLGHSFYGVPFEAAAGAKTVLVIGAGSGNDVAAALLHGVERVDAAEIDPVIAELGRKHHLAKPYADERVRVLIGDARSVLTRAEDRYDLIVFALTDSLVKVSPMTQLRLENYVYTVESVRRAYELLNEGGSLVFYNYYRQSWLFDRMVEMIWQATGTHARSIFHQGDFWMLMARKGDAIADVSPSKTAIEAPSDDWPFLYIRGRSIPQVYQTAMIGMCVLVILLLFTLRRSMRTDLELANMRNRRRIEFAFVLMGAAFLLLETKGVIQFSLLFGTTWVNNSLVFLAVLLLVLVANWLATRIRSRALLVVAFVAVLVAALATVIFPLSGLLSVENAPMRFVLASLMTFSPIFFANLIFSVTFADQPVAERLFGYNLIGATLGGVAEYTSMLWGYDALAVVVAVAYAIVFALLWSARVGGKRAECA